METLDKFFPRCLDYVAQEIASGQYQMFSHRLSAEEVDGEWVIFAPNDFIMRILRDSFLPKMQEFKQKNAPDAPELVLRKGLGAIKAHAVAELPKTTPVDTTVETPKPPTSKAKANLASTEVVATVAQNPGYEHTRLQPENTFETLVLGKGNRIAYAAGEAVADMLGKPDQNPLFIYGSTGLGKTHLVQAVGNRVYQQQPSARVRYVHADKYVNDYVKAVRRKDWDEFKRHYQNLDLLIMDDVQFIAGKEKTMEEFFYLFNHFIDGNKQIILTSDCLPREINKMSDRLTSRFAQGLTLEIEPPELEMRQAILRKKAEAARLRLPEESISWIAHAIRSNVRTLEGALKKVGAYCRFANVEPTVDVVKTALKDILASEQKQVTIEEIQKVVCDFFQVKLSELRSNKRERRITRPRHIAMSLARDLTTMSLPAIAEAFCRKDHTTVMNACSNVEKLRASEPEFDQTYTILLSMLQH